MKFKSLLIFSILTLSFIFSTLILDTQAAYYDSTGLTETLNSAGSAGLALKSLENPQSQITGIVGTILSFVGVAFLLLMIYGGILWMLSQGNDTQIKKAKDIIINGIIGLVIITLAYAITSYIGTALTN